MLCLLRSVTISAEKSGAVAVGGTTGSVRALLFVLRKNYGLRVLHCAYLLVNFINHERNDKRSVSLVTAVIIFLDKNTYLDNSNYKIS